MTSDVTIYHISSEIIEKNIFGANAPCCVNIIDTPGFGDSRGINWDRKIEEMCKGLLYQLECLDYVMCVVKASQNRCDIPSTFIY